MSTLIILLRTVSLLAFAGPSLLAVTGRCGDPGASTSEWHATYHRDRPGMSAFEYDKR